MVFSGQMNNIIESHFIRSANNMRNVGPINKSAVRDYNGSGDV